MLDTNEVPSDNTLIPRRLHGQGIITCLLRQAVTSERKLRVRPNLRVALQKDTSLLNARTSKSMWMTETRKVRPRSHSGVSTRRFTSKTFQN